jgi:type I restriction enzyme R subunit
MRITGDNQEGKDQLDNFTNPDSEYPSLVTTSMLLTTGVDVKTCKLIVLDKNINSMTEFKQIIGRGTRLDSDRGKDFFTIIDFRGATNLFADPEFDGEPEEVIIVPNIDIPEEISPKPEELYTDSEDVTYGVSEKPEKYYINDKNVKIINDQVQIMDENGNLITESLTDYTRKNILKEFATLDEFISAWRRAEKKQEILELLEQENVFLYEIRKQEHITSLEIDDFDLLLQLAYGQKPLTKAERVNNVKKSGYLYKYSDEARAVLELLLEKYMNLGIEDVENIDILKLPEFEKHGGFVKIIKDFFGNKTKYNEAILELENELYSLLTNEETNNDKKFVCKKNSRYYT